jgi:EAL domain-containing protein (putative c-di-GMP-specific phosphodiesterase class I)
MAPKIGRLRELGIPVAIDDFGTGYSSFSYLEKLPVAAVKIDRSFVEFLEAAPKARTVVKGMVLLAHSIGLRVVVEGVETAGQLEALLESEADDVQGFLLGGPGPVETHMPKPAAPKPATAPASRVEPQAEG